MRTSALQTDGPSKVLLYAHHGFGKTFQCRYYQKRYGKGLILSGESGLKSIEDTDIEFLPFSSWDGRHEPEEGIYSFKGIVRMLHSLEFKAAGYKWIAIDSLTELSERILDHLEKEEARKVAEGAKPNGFAVWGDYARLLIGALKWVRDLPIHVFVTCLAKEESDDNDATSYWPFVKGQAVSKQVPALFDHVFGGIRSTEKDDSGKVRVKRFVATDEVMGWHGKTRDPLNRLAPLEPVTDITELLARMASKEEELI